MKLLVVLTAIASAALCGGAAGQEYPTRPIRLLSPFPPGGFNDALSRIVGARFTDAWGQQVVVDNRPGANMIVASALVAKAAPDGYTLMMAAVPHAINPSLYKLPYDSIKDFTPLAIICSVPNMVVIHPAVPVNTIKELIAYAKANPKKISFASTGVGSSAHLAGELLKLSSGTDMVHVPYKGVAVALPDLLAGRVHLYIGAIATTVPHVRSGRLRALGVTTLKRVPAHADLPTVNETVPGFNVSSWYGLIGPGGMPPAIVKKLHGGLKRVWEAPDVRDRLYKDGAEVVGSTPEEFATTIREDMQTWMRVVKATGITPE